MESTLHPQLRLFTAKTSNPGSAVICWKRTSRNSHKPTVHENGCDNSSDIEDCTFFQSPIIFDATGGKVLATVRNDTDLQKQVRSLQGRRKFSYFTVIK